MHTIHQTQKQTHTKQNNKPPNKQTHTDTQKNIWFCISTNKTTTQQHDTHVKTKNTNNTQKQEHKTKQHKNNTSSKQKQEHIIIYKKKTANIRKQKNTKQTKHKSKITRQTYTNDTHQRTKKIESNTQ